MRLARLKPFIGILVMAVAVAGMYLWESRGREVLLTQKVLTVTDEVEAGEVLSEDMLSSKAYLRENVAEGALLAGEEDFAVGLKTKVNLHSGTQLNEAYLAVPGEPAKDMSSFAISRSEISHLSPSLRAGDTVDLFTEDLGERLGRFKLSYVRDEKGQPVFEADGTDGSDFFSRGESTGEIETIEIMSSLEEYKAIRAYLSSHAGIVVVQVMDDLSGGKED